LRKVVEIIGLKEVEEEEDCRCGGDGDDFFIRSEAMVIVLNLLATVELK
jgi:hypothetical protein